MGSAGKGVFVGAGEDVGDGSGVPTSCAGSAACSEGVAVTSTGISGEQAAIRMSNIGSIIYFMVRCMMFSPG